MRRLMHAAYAIHRPTWILIFNKKVRAGFFLVLISLFLIGLKTAVL